MMPFLKTKIKVDPHWAAVVLLVAVGFILYSNTLKSEFHFDDFGFIIDNPAIYHLEDIRSIWNMTAPRFIANLTFAINYFLGGIDPFGYHLFNIFNHILTAILVWWLTLLTLATPRMRESSIHFPRFGFALAVALLFLTHPLATTAVNHVTQRYTSLVALFYLASVCFFVRGRLEHKPIFFLGTIVFAGLGMFTKQSAITIPLVLLAYDACFFPREKDRRTSLRLKLFYLGMALIAGLIFVRFFGYSLSALLSHRVVSQSHEGDILNPLNYFLTQPYVLLTYLRLLFVPLGLNFDPDVPVAVSFWEPRIFFSSLFLLGLLGLAGSLLRRQPLVAFGILWFFITLSVESSFILISYVMAEYRTYLPSFGVCLAVCAATYPLFSNRRTVFIFAGLVVLLFSGLTIERNKVWDNEIVFWQDVVRKSPTKSRPYHNLGASYYLIGNLPKAIEYLEKAFFIDPLNVEESYNLASCYMDLEDFPRALAYLERAKALAPNHVYVVNALGTYYLRQNQLEKAKETLLPAYQQLTKYAEPGLNLAEVYRRQKNFPAAIEIYRETLFRFPHKTGIYLNWIQVCFEQGSSTEGVAVGKILLQKVNDARILTNAGSIFAAHNYGNLAQALYSKSLLQDPALKQTYLELGKLYGNQNQFDSAITAWKAGQKLDPNDEQFARLIAQAEAIERQVAP